MRRVRLTLSAPVAALAVASALPACVVGATPFVGYGTRSGVVAGGELGGGLPVVQGAVGYQTGGFGPYGRGDLTYDLLGHCDGEPSPRFGGRLGYARTVGGRSAVAAGGDDGVIVAHPELGPTEDSSGFDSWGVHGGIELRRSDDEWLVVLTGRISLRTQFCADDIPGAN